MKENLEDDSSASQSTNAANTMSNNNDSKCIRRAIDILTAGFKCENVMTANNFEKDGDGSQQLTDCSMLETGNENNDQHDWKSVPPRQPQHSTEQLQALQTIQLDSEPLVTLGTNSDGVRSLPNKCDKLTMATTECSTKKRNHNTSNSTPHPSNTLQSPLKKKKINVLTCVNNTNNDINGTHKPMEDSTNASTNGRWTPLEHQAFLLGMAVHGREWKKVAEKIPTRTSAQVRSHAQKYFAKVERQQQINSSSTASPPHDGTVATSFSDDYYQFDIDLTLAKTAIPTRDGASIITPYIASGNVNTEYRHNPAGKGTNNRVVLAPPIQHLTETAQQEAVRIISSPATVEAEVQDTLQRLHERYRQLQQQLQDRQQTRQRQQEEQQEAQAAVLEEQQQHLQQEPVIVDNDPHQQHDDGSNLHSNHDDQVQNDDNASNQRAPHQYPNNALGGVFGQGQLTKNSGSKCDLNNTINQHNFSIEGARQHFISKSDHNRREQNRRNSSNSSTCCSMSTSTNNDSTSSLLLLAESVVQVQAEDEIIALNVLRNGLYQHMLLHSQDKKDSLATAAATKLQITIDLDDNNVEYNVDNISERGVSNNELWNNSSIPSNPVVEKHDSCDENSYSGKILEEDILK
jgi:SHAQKYF class myb-like DNA-binding protein